MIQAKCIQKFRDKNNNIKGYLLEDCNGQQLQVSAEQLKMSIFSKQIEIINLTLTKDGRLIDKEAQVQPVSKDIISEEFYDKMQTELSYIECSKQDDSEMFSKINKYHIGLLDTDEDKTYKLTRSRYADIAWLDYYGKVTRERKDSLFLSNLKNRDIMLIVRENINMEHEYRKDMFYCGDNLVVCKDGRYCKSYRIYKKGHEAKCLELEITREQFELTASAGGLKNVSKAAVEHICNFLQIDKQKAEQYYNMNCKKRRPSK